MDVTEERKKAIWDELITIGSKRTDSLQPGERTVHMLMEEYDLSESQIKRKLRSLEELGKITKRRVVIGGTSRLAYTIKE